jgi:hypothetical protein
MTSDIFDNGIIDANTERIEVMQFCCSLVSCFASTTATATADAAAAAAAEVDATEVDAAAAGGGGTN